jgi:hypothetical protein
MMKTFYSNEETSIFWECAMCQAYVMTMTSHLAFPSPSYCYLNYIKKLKLCLARALVRSRLKTEVWQLWNPSSSTNSKCHPHSLSCSKPQFPFCAVSVLLFASLIEVLCWHCLLVTQDDLLDTRELQKNITTWYGILSNPREVAGLFVQ